MSQTVKKRIADIQAKLKDSEVYAYIFPSTDPHMSEYVADRWKARGWVSGFHGSAGTVVVTREAAALWTDSRYFIEGAEAISGTGISLMKMGEPGTPSIPVWIASSHREHASDAPLSAGIDAAVCSLGYRNELSAESNGLGLEIVAGADILEGAIWKDRPTIPASNIYDLPAEVTGETREARISRLIAWLKEQSADAVLLTGLDEIAWLLNVRGSDVEANPVFYAWYVQTADQGMLYAHGESIPKPLKDALKKAGVVIHGYDEVTGEIAQLCSNSAFRLISDPANLNVSLATAAGGNLVTRTSPVKLWKACKTEVELASTRDVMIRDGVAMVRIIATIEQKIRDGEELSEMQVSDLIRDIRSRDDAFIGESFRSIVGWKDHGAVVHYSVSPESSKPIEGSGLLLIDSGGQYRDGTTDITRTLGFHDIDRSMKEHYTLVLQGHIRLATAVFPRGTTGVQLDLLARQPLWDRGLNYGHGTGHGVGFALNVHEGPQNISPKQVNVPLIEGMITSNEPGYYVEGSHGIRIENLVATEEHPDFPGYLRFETLTLCPIALSLIVKDMLTPAEINWLNSYHETVWRLLSPHVEPELRMWLQHKTRKL